MKIRKAMKLANEDKRVRRPGWFAGLYCVSEGDDIVFVDERTGFRKKEFELTISDILANDWEVVE